eukprot:NODE_2193_length_748_cov_78.699571_g1767_i0.p1 GENE.NODE_2193_length_748_cov_78.699571_g1767_i0~~NODE_2193_length_748_cov_78.699571_g1767_i0.p1  ORF type:complete len:182 (-),score=37.90 NODE_2193_length_748_cov_78.699571_g1767_i0:135-680(-)
MDNKKVQRIRLIVTCVFILVMMILLDMPLSRMHYWFRIHTVVTVHKNQLMKELRTSGGHCNITQEEVGGEYFRNCTEFCAQAEKLSDDRHEVLMAVRSRHPFGGGPGGFMFDLGRGVFSQKNKMKKIKSRTCERLVMSVDKMNPIANGVCVFWILLTFLICTYLFFTLPKTSVAKRNYKAH